MRNILKDLATVAIILISILVAAALAFCFTDWYLSPEKVRNLTGDEFSQEQQITQIKKDVLQITFQIAGGLSLIAGAYFALQKLNVSREDQITDRFTRAIEQLGNEHLEVRLGGIYALERIAKDSSKDQETVMEVLTAYFREKASKQKTKTKDTGEEKDELVDEEINLNVEPIILNEDMQAILTILARCKWIDLTRVDLSRVNLKEHYLYQSRLNKAKLIQANLSKAILIEADLRKTNLSTAKLTMTNLSRANLSKANLSYANLDGVSLMGANLRHADLSGALLRAVKISGDSFGPHFRQADLREANLSRADFSGAWLNKANLSGADLFKTNMRTAQGISPEQIMLAKNWKKAFYNDDFKFQLEVASKQERAEENPEEQPPTPN